MSATLVVRHTVSDYSAWKKVYDEVGTLRSKHGCTAERVLRAPSNPNDVLVTHDFPSLAQAESFAGDPALGEAMKNAGVAGAPRIEIFQVS
jgi:hypothetical protein